MSFVFNLMQFVLQMMNEKGSHKAYGLACMIDIMANGLSGVGPGFITGGGGSVFTATNIEAFQSIEDYHEYADPFFEGLRTSQPAPGEERVLYPGLVGGELRKQRSAEGIPYHPEVLNWFQQAAAALGHAGFSAAVAEVSFQWKNPDFLLKNDDFIINTMDFALKMMNFGRPGPRWSLRITVKRRQRTG